MPDGPRLCPGCSSFLSWNESSKSWECSSCGQEWSPTTVEDHHHDR